MGDLVAPVEPVKGSGSGLGLDDPKDLDAPSGDVVVPEVLDASEVLDAPVASGPPKEKKKWVREPSPLDRVPESECLRHRALGIAVGVRGVPGMDPLNVGGVPYVWKGDFQASLDAGAEPSAFYKSLGEAAPYLVEGIQSDKYAPWVLTGDNGFSIFDRFGGDNPKELVDVENTTFLTEFSELEAAPRTQKEMFEMSLEQGRACFEEWEEIDLNQTSEIKCPLGKKQRTWMISPDSMLLDLVERGMGPAYWRVHESFLINWIMGLAMRQAFGLPTSWSCGGAQRYIPLAAVPSIERAVESVKNCTDYSRLWRSVSPIFTETLAPRCEAENLPGHVWVTGLGYLPEAAFEKIKEYACPQGENHSDFDGISRDAIIVMTNWSYDILFRVTSRKFSSNPNFPELGHHFVDWWDLNLSRQPVYADGCRLVCSPLFCGTGSIASMFGMRRKPWFTQEMMGGIAPAGCWDFQGGGPKLSSVLPTIPISIHMPSLYAVTNYLQYLEDRRPLSSEGRRYLGMKFPEKFLRPDEEIAFPSGVEDKPFRRRYQTALDKAREREENNR